ncbi:hypothetical protein OPT61_g8315 [Boeremia exigua]|uniref:Uncharacterized protein n=1 Tax=Boeremia exigua TaxID=749465 RepID=A0ACC2HZK8_9PLEO|nr:hypothetical protein OPT61_g8315 [Boeremia exigua]
MTSTTTNAQPAASSFLSTQASSPCCPSLAQLRGVPCVPYWENDANIISWADQVDMSEGQKRFSRRIQAMSGSAMTPESEVENVTNRINDIALDTTTSENFPDAIHRHPVTQKSIQSRGHVQAASGKSIRLGYGKGSTPPTEDETNNSTTSKTCVTGMSSLGWMDRFPKAVANPTFSKLPPLALELWKKVALALDKEGVLPKAASGWDEFNLSDGLQMPRWFGADNGGRSKNALREDRKRMSELHEASIEEFRQLNPESSWNYLVHGPMLAHALGDDPDFKVDYITSVRIAKRYMSEAHNSILQSKMIDFTIMSQGLSSQVKDFLKDHVPNDTINHVQRELGYDYYPFAVAIETKKDGGSIDQALAQLAVWVAAEFNRWREIVFGHPKKGVLKLPIPIIVVIGSMWYLYVATDDPKNIQLNRLGLMGDTTQLVDLYQILAVLRILLKWLKKKWLPAFRTEILSM